MRITVSFTTAQGVTIQTNFAGIQAVIDSQMTHLTPGSKKSLRIMGPKSTGLRDIVLNGVTANQEVLPPNFSLAAYTGDKAAILFLGNLRDQMVSEIGKIEDTIFVLNHQQMGDTDICAGYLESGAKTNSSVNTVWEEVVAFRKKHPLVHAQSSVPAAGSVLSENVKKGSLFTNFGTTVFTLFQNTMTTGGIQVGPNDSHIIPDGWENFTAVNGSTTGPGIYSLS